MHSMLSRFATLAALLPAAIQAQGGYGGSGEYSLGFENLPGSIYKPSTNWANANWPPQNVGVALVPQAPDQELIELLDGISVPRTYISQSAKGRHTDAYPQASNTSCEP